MSKEIEEKTATEWCDLGFELGKEGKFQEGIEYFENAIKLEPDHEKAYKQREYNVLQEKFYFLQNHELINYPEHFLKTAR